MKKTVIDSVYKDYVFSGEKKSDVYKTYRFENETGFGKMRTYSLLEGVQISFNDLNMETAYQEFQSKPGYLQIDHCLDGCYEIKLKNHEYAFFGRGDLGIMDLGNLEFENSRVPMKRYKGLTVFIDIDLAKRTFEKQFPFLDVNVKKIRDKFCGKNGFSIINTKIEISDILSKLYSANDREHLSFLILHVIEFLLLLGIVEYKNMSKIHSFSKPVYDATRECYKDLVDNPFDKHTISELAKKYGVSESSLKRCFSHIAGNSLGGFRKKLLMESISKLLIHNKDMSIKEISTIAGYVNQSKFSSAFKDYFGVTPSKYRRKHS